MAVNEFITQLERFLKNGINFSKLDQKEFKIVSSVLNPLQDKINASIRKYKELTEWQKR